MYRLFNIDSASLRIFARRPNMLFCYVVTLNHYTLLLRYHTQDSAGSAFVVTSYNLDYITFFYMRSHKKSKNQNEKIKITIQNSKCFVEMTIRHFDRSDAKHRGAEKSIKKQISRLALAGPFRHRQTRNDIYNVFYRANSKFLLSFLIFQL